MEKFIPKEKLSKKARRQLDSGARHTWLINPVSRKSRDQKRYDRKRARRWDIDGGSFNAAQRAAFD